MTKNLNEKTVSMYVTELEPGDVLVGSYGGHSSVEDVAPSSARPGLYVVETEHGALYLDPELEVEVLAS